ncbi:hypothetical protein ACJJTC_007000 [Scirpophaga incertulas]
MSCRRKGENIKQYFYMASTKIFSMTEMIHNVVQLITYSFSLSVLYVQSESNDGKLVIDNLKLRHSIPLYEIGRRFDNDEKLKYRKTKDIKETRKFQITDNLLRSMNMENDEALEKLEREIRWLPHSSEDGFGVRI